MTDKATVSVEFVIRTERGVYTPAQAQFEVANLQAGLADIETKQAAIQAAKEAEVIDG